MYDKGNNKKSKVALLEGLTSGKVPLESLLPEKWLIFIDGEVYSFDSPALTDKGVFKSQWLTDWNKAPIMELSPENEALVWDIIKDTFYRKMGELFD